MTPATIGPLLAQMTPAQIAKVYRFAVAVLSEETRPLESERTRRARERAFEAEQMPDEIERVRQGREL